MDAWSGFCFLPLHPPLFFNQEMAGRDGQGTEIVCHVCISVLILHPDLCPIADQALRCLRASIIYETAPMRRYALSLIIALFVHFM